MSCLCYQRVLALLVCLLCPLLCAAQQRVSGTVTDKRTHPSAATVQLESGVLPVALTTTTDAAGERTPAAFDQIHTAVGGLTWRAHRSGFWTSAAFDYGSGTPATLRDAAGNEMLVRLPDHFVANLYFG